MNSERLDLGPPTLAFHKPACLGSLQLHPSSFACGGSCSQTSRSLDPSHQPFHWFPFSWVVSLHSGGFFFQSSGRSSFCPVDYLHSSPVCTQKGIYTFLRVASEPLPLLPSPTPTRVSLSSAHTSYALCMFFHFSQLSLAPSYPGPRSNEVSRLHLPHSPVQSSQSREHTVQVSLFHHFTIHVTVPCLSHGPWASLSRICHVSTPFPSLAYSRGLISA